MPSAKLTVRQAIEIGLAIFPFHLLESLVYLARCRCSHHLLSFRECCQDLALPRSLGEAPRGIDEDL